MSVNFNIRVSDEEAAEFREQAKRLEVTLTAHLRRLLGLDGGYPSRDARKDEPVRESRELRPVQATVTVLPSVHPAAVKPVSRPAQPLKGRYSTDPKDRCLKCRERKDRPLATIQPCGACPYFPTWAAASH